MLCRDAVSGRGVTNTVSESAEVDRLRHPITGNPLLVSLQPRSASSGLSAHGIDVASQVRLVLRVAQENDSLDSVESSTSELRHCIDGSSGTLRVALEDEAGVRVRCEGVLNFGDDSSGTAGRVLGEVGGIDSVVLGTTRDSRSDLLVHSNEARRRTLRFACTAGVDDYIRRAGSTLVERCGLHSSRKSEEEGDERRLGKHFDAGL